MKAKSGRTFASQQVNQMDEYNLIAQAGYVKWVIYDGPISENENAPGWIDSQNSASCIPYALNHSLDGLASDRAIDLVRQNIRIIRINETNIKFRPKPDTHVIKAPPPEARPFEGYLERHPVPRRESFGAVQVGNPASMEANTFEGKVRKLKSELKNTGLDELLYPKEDDVWFGNIRQAQAKTEIFTNVDQDPLVSISNQSMTINTTGTSFAHEPYATKFRTKQINPLSEVLPSTSAVPVDIYIPYLGEVMSIVAIAKSIAEFFKKNADGSYSDFVSSTDRITEVVDYQTMKRWYTYEENV